MHALLRSWLVWLLLLALPVQALAVTRAQHCAPMHERMHLAATAAQGHPAGHLAGHSADHPHAAAAQGAGADSAAAESSTATPEAGAAKCSACASCCPALGLPTRAAELLSAPTVATAVEWPGIHVDSFVPGGLDRPPRLSLA